MLFNRKLKTADLSETNATCDLKVVRCRQLIDFMRYASIQGHFLTLVLGNLRVKIKSCFSQKLLLNL